MKAAIILAIELPGKNITIDSDPERSIAMDEKKDINGKIRSLSLLRKNDDIVSEIDWDMTPEEAVRLYLEWGNNWAGGNFVIRSRDDVSYYFVVNTWSGYPVLFLVKRNSEDATELAEIKLPGDLAKRFMESVGGNKGVYAVSQEIKEWLWSSLHGGC